MAYAIKKISSILGVALVAAALFGWGSQHVSCATLLGHTACVVRIN